MNNRLDLHSFNRDDDRSAKADSKIREILKREAALKSRGDKRVVVHQNLDSSLGGLRWTRTNYEPYRLLASKITVINLSETQGVNPWRVLVVVSLESLQIFQKKGRGASTQ